MKLKISNIATLFFLISGTLLTSCTSEKEVEIDAIEEEVLEEIEEEDFSNYEWNQLGEAIDVIYGASMDLNSTGDKIIVGSSDAPSACSYFCDGVVRVYDFKNGKWTQVNGDLYGSSSQTDFIGYDVAINDSGNLIATSYYGFGHVSGDYTTRIFQNINGEWVQMEQGLPREMAITKFGHSLSMNAKGDILAISKPESREDTVVKLYKLNSDNKWVQIGEDINPGYFGSYEIQVDLNSQGNILAVGEYNILRVGGNKVDFYEITENGWSHINQMQDTYIGENISADIDLSSDGSTIILAGYTENDCNSNICVEPPQISVYQRNGSELKQKGQIITWEEEGYKVNNEQAVAIDKNGKRIAIGLKRSYPNASYINETFVLIFQYSESEKQWKQMPTIEIGRESKGILSAEFNDEGNIISVVSSEFQTKRVRVYKLEPL